MTKLIYSVEDDKGIALIINQTLMKMGFEVETFYDAESFYEGFKRRKPDMILLDMMLPDEPGEEILRKVRADSRNDDIHIIMITANHLITDKVKSFDLGADDYIEKPFDLLELMSRVQSKFRRDDKEIKEEQITEDLKIDYDKRQVISKDEIVNLTNREYEVFSYLVKNKGKVVSRDDLLKYIWDTDAAVESRTIDMHILSIRKKLDDRDGVLIKTFYGVGYLLDV